jgi:hypothetical protein
MVKDMDRNMQQILNKTSVNSNNRMLYTWNLCCIDDQSSTYHDTQQDAGNKDTNSTELSHSWEKASCAATQELPNILWNPKVHYHIHKSLLTFPPTYYMHSSSPPRMLYALPIPLSLIWSFYL